MGNLWNSKRSLQATIVGLKRENSKLKQEIDELQNIVWGLENIGHCVSNYCLNCKYALVTGNSYDRKAVGCIREKLCPNFSVFMETSFVIQSEDDLIALSQAMCDRAQEAQAPSDKKSPEPEPDPNHPD